MKINAPCMDCPERHVGCHGQCEQYKAFQAEKHKEYAWRAEQCMLDRPNPAKSRNIRRAMVMKARFGR